MTEQVHRYDAVIVGAGMSGLYQLIKLRQLGLRVRLFEMGTSVGGVWAWNRYPGARFDSESITYAYAFSKEVAQEWNWSEAFASQPETERYLNFVADKFNIRGDIQLEARVEQAHWQEEARTWRVRLADGSLHDCRYLVTALGPLSAPTLPNIPGRDDFRGAAYHTSRWPKDPVSFSGKRVGVIGTGSTGVQVIQEISKTARHLTVFQRRANWCAPLNNYEIKAEDQQALKASYPEAYRRCKETFAGYLHTPDPRSALEVSSEEREAFYEKLYNEPGFGIWLGNFRDILTSKEANKTISDFIARKIRERVKDPQIAERLIPKDHGFGTRRVPLETNYYECFNQSNVELVDSKSTPIQRITATGIETSECHREFDIIIYATGFDALTGAYDRIDIRGVHGRRLKEEWRESARTWAGLLCEGFPNMMMLLGPHTGLGNIPRSIEFVVEWTADFIAFLERHKLTRAEASREAVDAWMEVVRKSSEGLLSNEVDSWFTGVNSNVQGRQHRTLARYSGSLPAYREWVLARTRDRYDGVVLK